MDAEKSLSPEEILAELYRRRPELDSCRQAIEDAYGLLLACFSHGGKLLVCGNGGSASDSEHIVGELMKSFRFRRPVDPTFSAACPRMARRRAARDLARLPDLALHGIRER